MRRCLIILVIVMLSGCSAKAPSKVISPSAPTPVPKALACSETKDFFLSVIWPDILLPKCLGCHRHNDVGKLPLLAESEPDYLAANFASFRLSAHKKTDKNIRYTVAKPQGELHPVVVLHAGDAQEKAALDDLQTLSDSIVSCDETRPDFLVLNTAVQQLRKMTLHLAGRLPTTRELESVSTATDEPSAQAALDTVFDNVAAEDGFKQRLREIYNDLLLTDKYLTFNFVNFDTVVPAAADYTSQALIDAGYYLEETVADPSNPGGTITQPKLNAAGNKILGDKGRAIQRKLRFGLARAAVELIVQVVRGGKPFGEILTADYLWLNPFTAGLYRLTPDGAGAAYAFTYKNADGSIKNPLPDPDLYDETDFRQTTDGFFKDSDFHNTSPLGPQAGILTDLAFLQRYPSTLTNRNRHRARIVFKYFLDTDAEGLADRSEIKLDEVTETFPTYQNTRCRQCHDIIDPIAGMFKNRHDLGVYPGRYGPDCIKGIPCATSRWYSDRATPDMWPPGYTRNEIDTLADADYPRALPILAQRIVSDERFVRASIKWVFQALTGQSLETEPQYAEQLKQRFIDSGFNMKSIIKEVINSRFFRAAGLQDGASPQDYAGFGTARLLTPERLTAKIAALFNYQWRAPASGQRLTDGRTYTLFYGGIDSNDINERGTEPSPMMAAVQDRIALQTACAAVPADFALAKDQRRLFPYVETSDLPDDAAMTANIKRNIQYLLDTLLSESNGSDTEIAAVYNVYTEALQAIPVTTNIENTCQISGQTVINQDRSGTVRAWMAVVAYMMLDYRFLYE